MQIQGMDHMDGFLNREWLQKLSLPYAGTQDLEVDMLRLDRIHPLISGNKWLKLDYWLKKFHAGHYRGILTLGGPWSNHLHACGFACHLHKIDMVAMVKGHEDMHNPMLDDLRKWGTRIEFVNRAAFYDEDHPQSFASRHHYLLIPMGGEGPEGEAGVTAWLNQLPLSHYDYIFCSVGTGTTLAGIAKSELSCKQLVGVDPGTGDKRLKEKLFNLNTGNKTKQVLLIDAGGKIGKYSPDIFAFIMDWWHNTGIPLDRIYTAPMCQTFLKMTAAGQLLPGSRVLLVHTGGLQGNRSEPLLPIK